MADSRLTEPMGPNPALLTDPPRHPERRNTVRRHTKLLLFLLILSSALPWYLMSWTETQHLQRLQQTGNERLDLYTATLQSAIARFDYLPFIVSRDADVAALLQEPQQAARQDTVNRMLQAWNTAAGSSDLYLMDADGNTVAASNWQHDYSFVGSNYGYRPYFQDALNGSKGRFFAIGATTQKPGFFLSHPVWHQQRVIGVAVVKIKVDALQDDWAAGGEDILLVDRDGVVFLSSRPQWKYRSLRPLSDETRQRLKQERKYSGVHVTALPVDYTNGAAARLRTAKINTSDDPLQAEAFLIHSRSIPPLDWQLLYLSNLKDLQARKRDAAALGIMGACLIVLLGYVALQRRDSRRLQQLAHDELEARVERRTHDLNASNQCLREQIQERTRAEQELRKAQEELIQAAKLAALGQMSAGIAHEVNQPLAAMQTFLASTRLLLQRGELQTAEDNLQDIESLLRRMAEITGHLKAFASKSKGRCERISLTKIVDNALILLTPHLRREPIQLHWQAPDEAIYVMGDEIKLEQILINLLRNALDAMQGQDKGRVGIEVGIDQQRAYVQIRDNGPGLADDDLPQVFDPFFTTKEPGEGLGLGLSVSYGIAREFGGDLIAENDPEGGARFTLWLDQQEN